VPNVVGLTQSAATTAITTAGLVLGTVTQQSSAMVPAGNVISQSPAGGTGVAAGSAVSLVVSSGSTSKVSVPNVVGLTQSAATTAITNARLVLGIVTQQSSETVPAGSVISQKPKGGTKAAAGSAVKLVISNGPSNDISFDRLRSATLAADIKSKPLKSLLLFLIDNSERLAKRQKYLPAAEILDQYEWFVRHASPKEISQSTAANLISIAKELESELRKKGRKHNTSS
jgi:hypothetical protein